MVVATTEKKNQINSNDCDREAKKREKREN